MAVDVKRKRGGGVTDVLLYGFDVVTILQREHGCGADGIKKSAGRQHSLFVVVF